MRIKKTFPREFGLLQEMKKENYPAYTFLNQWLKAVAQLQSSSNLDFMTFVGYLEHEFVPNMAFPSKALEKPIDIQLTITDTSTINMFQEAKTAGLPYKSALTVLMRLLSKMLAKYGLSLAEIIYMFEAVDVHESTSVASVNVGSNDSEIHKEVKSTPEKTVTGTVTTQPEVSPEPVSEPVESPEEKAARIKKEMEEVTNQFNQASADKSDEDTTGQTVSTNKNLTSFMDFD